MADRCHSAYGKTGLRPDQSSPGLVQFLTGKRACPARVDLFAPGSDEEDRRSTLNSAEEDRFGDLIQFAPDPLGRHPRGRRRADFLGRGLQPGVA